MKHPFMNCVARAARHLIWLPPQRKNVPLFSLITFLSVNLFDNHTQHVKLRCKATLKKSAKSAHGDRSYDRKCALFWLGIFFSPVLRRLLLLLLLRLIVRNANFPPTCGGKYAVLTPTSYRQFFLGIPELKSKLQFSTTLTSRNRFSEIHYP